MKQHLEAFIYKRVSNPSTTDVKDILAAFQETTYQKGSFFKEFDTKIEHLGYLISGSARSYFLNEKGEEICYDIHQASSFLSDIISIRTGESSPVSIEFLEESQVLVAPMNKVWDLLGQSVTFNILIREYMGDRAMELMKLHHMFLNGTAKERYKYLLASNPALLQKYPLRFIASMIGVTPTQLSRIRKDIQ